jgi:hypothetical protein
LSEEQKRAKDETANEQSRDLHENVSRGGARGMGGYPVGDRIATISGSRGVEDHRESRRAPCLAGNVDTCGPKMSAKWLRAMPGS